MSIQPALTIGILGATGMVGRTYLDILQEDHDSRGFSIKKLYLFARASSTGRTLEFQGQDIVVEDFESPSLEKCDVLFFAVASEVAMELIPKFTAKGILCIDKSSAYREDEDVPLIVPEVNGEILTQELLRKRPLVSCPNCCAIPLTVILKPLHHAFSLKKIVVSTYQSVSGSGKVGCQTLAKEVEESFENNSFQRTVSSAYPKPIAFNAIPFVSHFEENGDTEEEDKIQKETKKLMNIPGLKIAVTSVRIPVYVGHSLAVTVMFDSLPENLDDIYSILKSAPGVKLVDQNYPLNDFNQNSNQAPSTFDRDFITPLEAQGQSDVFVSRIRKTEVFEHGISLWIVSDNLRKGAALNAIQTLESCIHAEFFD